MDHAETEGAINGLKNLLEQTDYMAIKHADGALTDKEYAPMREKRDGWRGQINLLEARLSEAQGQETE